MTGSAAGRSQRFGWLPRWMVNRDWTVSAWIYCYAVEETLFDRGGRATAYIASDGNTIYMWDGHAVAYLVDDKLYGWNGRHLGWFVNGVIYDSSGYRTGFNRSRCPVATYAAPAKYAKYARYAKYSRHAAYARPALSTGLSGTELAVLLRSGAVG